MDEAWREAFTLAKEAQDAGLVVVLMQPVAHDGRREYTTSLWTDDGRIWAEATHESAESVRIHIAAARGR